MTAPRYKYVAARPATGPLVYEARARRYIHQQPVVAHPGLHAFFRRIPLIILSLIALAALGTFLAKVLVDRGTAGSIYTPDNPSIPHNHVAIVFGAGLNGAGGPSAMLYDRISTAVGLYNDGKVDKLLFTGDNGATDYNEVAVMRQTALELGVPDQDIVLDHAGFSTYDSCYRARAVFGVTEATLVTQNFHLPRAVFTCGALGVKSTGVVADVQTYPTEANEAREIPALLSTFWSLIWGREPRFLGPHIDVDNPPGQ